MIEQKQFSGILNLDDNNDVLPSRHHKYALNVHFRGNPGNSRVENIPGNRLITNSLPAGTNQCIGALYDDVKFRVYYFNYNSNGRNGIYYYDTIAKAISPVLICYTDSSSADGDILNFNPTYPIASVDIIYGDTSDGDVLYWTDRLNRPKYLNVNTALNKTSTNAYWNSSTSVLNYKASYLTVARQMPLIAPICSYQSDLTKSQNNLRNRLYQIRYRWVYRDNTKSTWSPWGKLFAPANPDSLTTQTNPTQNNYIQATITTGDVDCNRIEMAVRSNLDTTWGNALLVDTLDKSALSISNNSTYNYNFYNNGSYEYVEEAESNLLFDYVPKKANTQSLINGNLLIYGGLTEGNTFDSTFNVSQPVTSLITNSAGAGGNPLVLTTGNTQASPPNNNSGYYYLFFSGAPQIGDIISVQFIITDSSKTYPLNTTSVTIPYTVASTTLSVVEAGFKAAMNANSTFANYHITITDQSTPALAIRMNSNNSLSQIVTAAPTITYATPPSGTTSDLNTAIYKHNSLYQFGICYFDEFGVTNGVVTNDLLKVITPEIVSSNLGNVALTIPNIQISVNSQPPSWAKYFSFARTNNITTTYFQTTTSDNTYQDLTYGYLDITKFQTNTSGWDNYQYTVGDRLRLIGRFGQAVNTVSAAPTVSSCYDYPILEVVTYTVKPSGFPASFPAAGVYIKLQYDSNTMSNFGTTGYNNYYIEAYTPAKNTDATLQVFYEFGETYPVLNPGLSTRYHKGQQQDQTSSLPAIYNFYRGDCYERQRSNALWILDQSVFDSFGSKVIGTGRPFVIDPYAREIYNGSLVRYGGSYQTGTTINQTNRFYFINFDEYDRNKGDIQRMKLREKALRIFFSRGQGVVNVYATEMTNQDGSTNLIGSTQILNPINYYLGEYGIGNQYCSLVSSGKSDYYVDPITGYHIRLSRDGITPLTELYKGQYFFPAIANKYIDTGYTRTDGGYAKILGVYDNFEEEYISIFQTGTKSSVTLTPYTVGFNESKNAYSSFYSFNPEWAISAENLVITWSSGGLYLHDSATKNNFYGTQYSSSISFVFNKDNIIKKTFDYVTLDASDYWVSSTMGDINTSLSQSSNLVSGDYEIHEGMYHAALQRDNNSLGGIINGDYLKGSWLEAKFTNSGTSLVYLSGLYLGYLTSNRFL